MLFTKILLRPFRAYQFYLHLFTGLHPVLFILRPCGAKYNYIFQISSSLQSPSFPFPLGRIGWAGLPNSYSPTHPNSSLHLPPQSLLHLSATLFSFYHPSVHLLRYCFFQTQLMLCYINHPAHAAFVLK